ncbi:MAG: helix-turn-helix transcriptional regulator [Deltaproteobacteria bacterium]|nr:helix-turn-helix transcriptional regulator [Deltaproteobacteria bacterium]
MTFGRFQKRLGAKLAELRGGAGLTQQEAAEAAGITRQHLQRVEYGLANPKAETLYELARIYKLTIAELVEV